MDVHDLQLRSSNLVRLTLLHSFKNLVRDFGNLVVANWLEVLQEVLEEVPVYDERRQSKELLQYGARSLYVLLSRLSKERWVS